MDGADPGTGTQQTTDPRAEALRNSLNDALLEVENGEYFRSRVHGWAAYRYDADVHLPESVASRLTSLFSFARPENAADVSTLDAFVLAYHAAESLCRQILALLEGGAPGGLPLIALSELKAGPAFNDRLSRLAGLPDADLSELLDYLFLPTEIQETWPADFPGIDSVQEYLRLGVRWLAGYIAEWRNPYNSAKHGLAVGARPMQLSFVTEGETRQQDLMLMDGPTLRTVEHEPVTDSQGKPVKGPDGKRVVRWFWVHRAVDPEELIAQAIVTADLLDWLRNIAVIRLQGRPGPVTYRTEPKPLDIQRRTTPGTRFRYDLATFALPSEEADALLSGIDAD